MKRLGENTEFLGGGVHPTVTRSHPRTCLYSLLTSKGPRHVPPSPTPPPHEHLTIKPSEREAQCSRKSRRLDDEGVNVPRADSDALMYKWLVRVTEPGPCTCRGSLCPPTS